jgi:formamidopyrimidine-DNA glycosylase
VPEGHTLHRLAHELSELFLDRRLTVSSPQGRFADGAALLDGSRFLESHAHGKHLFVTTGWRRQRFLLHVHLGLYGTFELLHRRRGADPPAVRGQVRLRLLAPGAVADLRGPTACELLRPDEYDALIDRLGPDPLHAGEDGELAWQRIQRSPSGVGSLLMKQDVIAGVGNVYRAEVLFRHGVDPFLPGRQLAHAVWLDLWSDLQGLMADGVRIGRIDTVRDEHLPEVMGRDPRQDRHGGEVYVYRRAGDPCLLCGTPVSTTVIDGRNLFWCASCQPRGAGSMAG